MYQKSPKTVIDERSEPDTCEKKGVIIIKKNERITKEHFWKDGVHSGKIISARNFIKYLNDFLYDNRSKSPHR